MNTNAVSGKVRRVAGKKDPDKVPANPFSIWNYFDYKQFLRDFYSHKKRLNPGFSYRGFARKAGYQSPGLYLAVANGARRMTPSLIQKFLVAMGMPSGESLYFEAMVNYGQCEGEEAAKEYFRRMVSLTPPRARKLDASHNSYFGNWHNIAVREAVNAIETRENLDELVAFVSPLITREQAAEAIRALCALGLIEFNESRIWRPCERSVASSQAVDQAALRKYQKSMVELSLPAFKLPGTERNLSCITCSLSRAGFQAVSRKIDHFRRELMETVRADKNVTGVYQINFQLFPLFPGSETTAGIKT
jgi:uncharacterized protein (TIGR02147 family)